MKRLVFLAAVGATMAASANAATWFAYDKAISVASFLFIGMFWFRYYRVRG